MSRSSLAASTTGTTPADQGETRAKSLQVGTGASGLVNYVKARATASRTMTLEDRQEDIDDARSRARALTRAIPRDDVAALFREHGELSDRLLDDGDLSRKDRARLTYVRWRLERIEDAQIGESIDALERLAAMHEAISADVANFAEHVKSVSAPRRGAR